MSLAKQKVVATDFETKWETLKANGLEAKMASLHQGTAMFSRTERTVSHTKFPNIKLWWTSAGLLCEFGEQKELLPQAAIAKVQF